MSTPEERTAAHRAALAQTPTYPIRYCSGGQSTAPEAFSGLWIHTSAVKDKILAGGWKPELLTSTIYGAAVYLSRGEWYPDTGVIRVRLNLSESDVMQSFKHAGGEGSKRDDLLWYLKEQKVVCGYSAGMGSSAHNRRIRDHFLSVGIKAIRFEEHGEEVVAVYAPDCIEVLDESDEGILDRLARAFTKACGCVHRG